MVSTLSAQNGKKVLVKAGTKVVDYYSHDERFRYFKFQPGQVLLKNGQSVELNLNYDILFGEMVFVQNNDTMAISKKKDIKYIALQDTFYYDNGYIESMTSVSPKIGVRKFVKLSSIIKKGAYGTNARAGSVDTFNSISAEGNTFDLIPDEDIELKTLYLYYIMKPDGDFVELNKKNLSQLYPEKSEAIKTYIKSNKLSLDSGDDLLKLAAYIRSL
jgi:hypothetical protein